MVGLMRLPVCGGLFVAGHYRGRQSLRLESQQDPADAPGESGAVGGRDDVAATRNKMG